MRGWVLTIIAFDCLKERMRGFDYGMGWDGMAFNMRERGLGY